MHHDSYLMLQLVETNSNLFHLKCLYSMLVRMVVQSKKRLWRYNKNIQVIGQDLWPWTRRDTMLVMAQWCKWFQQKIWSKPKNGHSVSASIHQHLATNIHGSVFCIPQHCIRHDIFDQDWRMNCCQRRRKICPTEISKWLTIKSKSSMTVKCTT